MKTALTITLFALISMLYSGERVLGKADYPLYNGGQILLLTPENKLPFSVQDFCREIQKINPGDPAIRCRLAGEWARDTLVRNYLYWLKANLRPDLGEREILARDSAVRARLRSLGNEYLLILLSGVSNDGFDASDYALLYTSGNTTPSLVIRYANGTLKTVSSVVIEDFFARQRVRMPTADEAEAARQAPNRYYQEQSVLDWYVGAGGGYTAANHPLTPRSWSGHETQETPVRYGEVADSISAWNWLEDQSRLLLLEGGVLYNRIIGGDLRVAYSRHSVKYDAKDSIHDPIQNWYYDRLELSILLKMGKTFYPAATLEIMPYGFLGYLYSFPIETFEIEDPAPDIADNRFKLENSYSGGLVGIGLRTTWNGMLGISLKSGLAARGLPSKSGSTITSGQTPQTEAQRTIDYFTTFSIFWNWRTFLD